MPASDREELFDRPVPAKVIGLPATNAAGDGGEPPTGELLAIAGLLIRNLDVIASHFGLRFVIDLQEL